ncbi:hypothetical protein BX616_003808 [Lobosporangium transversale]|nr:hypothetical protein BX616_003808 [Lobosporangium transversale]
MEDDLAKLAFMGKKAIDGLYADGYVLPVMLIHGRGMEVDVYQLSLDAEAFYCLRLHGTFRLISKPTEFGLLLGISPLISAQRVLRPALDRLNRAYVLKQIRLGEGGHLIAKE